MSQRSDFEADRQIDPEALDVECCHQVDLTMKWSELAVDARSLVERRKFELDTRQAEIELKIRTKPDRYGLPEKPTEGAIRAALQVDGDFQEASEKLLDAKKDSMWLDRAVDAMDMKKRMLEELIKLHGLQYFAGPSAPRDLASEWNARKEAREKRVQSKQVTVARKRGE